MNIKFGSDIIKISFDETEPYSGHSLVMNGEALSNGFDADESTMRWLAPFNNKSITAADKKVIRELVLAENQNSDFVIMFMEN